MLFYQNEISFFVEFMIFSESTFEPKMVHLFTNMFSINWQIRYMNHIWTTNTWGWLLELLPRAVDHFPFSFLKLISCQIFLSINDFMPNLAWQKFSQKKCPIEIPWRRKQGNDLAWTSYQVNCFYISFLATWRFLQVPRRKVSEKFGFHWMSCCTIWLQKWFGRGTKFASKFHTFANTAGPLRWLNAICHLHWLKNFISCLSLGQCFI